MLPSRNYLCSSLMTLWLCSSPASCSSSGVSFTFWAGEYLTVYIPFFDAGLCYLMTSLGTKSIRGLLLMKGVVSKVPSSRHCLITFLTVVCGRDR